MLLRNGRIVLADHVLERGWVQVDAARITALGPDDPPTCADIIDLDGSWVLPGFVDMHVHGGGGGSYLVADPAQARHARDFHRAHGTTTTVASLVTAAPQTLAAQLESLVDLVVDGTLAGVHLEGPFLSGARCGAHDPALLRDPDVALMDELIAAARGTIRMVTFAPELANSDALVELLVAAGVVAAVGHTDASYEAAMRAFDAGAAVATHLFNGMRGIDHRQPGPVVAAVNSPHVVVELINDGVHLHPAMVAATMGLVSARRVAFVSDAISAAGRPDGDYDIGSMKVRVRGNVATLAGGTSLAGSTLTLDEALRRGVEEVGLLIGDVSRALSGTPARVLGIDDVVGSLTAGKDADIVVLDERLSLTRVLSKGSWVDRSTVLGRPAMDDIGVLS